MLPGVRLVTMVDTNPGRSIYCSAYTHDDGRPRLVQIHLAEEASPRVREIQAALASSLDGSSDSAGPSRTSVLRRTSARRPTVMRY